MASNGVVGIRLSGIKRMKAASSQWRKQIISHDFSETKAKIKSAIAGEQRVRQVNSVLDNTQNKISELAKQLLKFESELEFLADRCSLFDNSTSESLQGATTSINNLKS